MNGKQTVNKRTGSLVGYEPMGLPPRLKLSKPWKQRGDKCAPIYCSVPCVSLPSYSGLVQWKVNEVTEVEPIHTSMP